MLVLFGCNLSLLCPNTPFGNGNVYSGPLFIGTMQLGFFMLGVLKIKRLFGSQETLSFELLNSVGILGALKTFKVGMNNFCLIASWGPRAECWVLNVKCQS